MPEIARFYGIIIRMFMEPLSQHHRPHFHAYYQESVAVVSIDKIEMLAGKVPGKQLHLIVTWAKLHKHELLTCWELLQQGQHPLKIDPLT